MERLLRAISTPTARLTAIYYFGNFSLNVGRYLFHLILLRFLVPAQYGEFLSYLSLTYLLGIPTGTLITVITKYVSEFKAKDDDASMKHFFYYLLKIIGPIALSLSLLLIIFANPLAALFKAHSTAFIVLGVSVFLSLFQTITMSYLIALQRFIFYTVIGFLGVASTIGLSILFINLGLGATGPVLAQLFAVLITTIIMFASLRAKLLPIEKGHTSPKFKISVFTGFSFIYALGTLSLISTDILTVRVFFDTHISGMYSALSILGRMILFGLTPLTTIVLPLATHRQIATGSARSVFFKLGGSLLLLGVVGAGIFTLFPVTVISLLSGTAYLEIAPLLSAFSLSMVFFALSQFMISYSMAIGLPQANFFLLFATILQPILFYLSRFSLPQAVYANFSIQLGLFLALLIFISIKGKLKNI